jgi:AraC family transcriptional regulator
MTDDARRAYAARFRKVLAFVDEHLDEALTVERLADVASLSKHHFHRQFAGVFGLNVHDVVQLSRLERASHELAFRAARSVLEIALDAAYESPEAFARAFKRRFGQTPTEFRERPDWDRWHAAIDPLHELRSVHMKEAPSEPITVVDFPETRVAVLEHRGDPRRIGDTIRRFIAWRRENHLPPPASATFNLFYGDPATTPPDEFRLDLCAGLKGPVAPNDAGVVERSIPAGRCARLRHVGSDDGLGASFDRLYREWLPGSGEEARDFPLFLRRVSFFPDVPEHEALTDIYLPLV